jgi:HD-GYP domain-containing protein (c-di-GMP phosphodiesterase class II)
MEAANPHGARAPLDQRFFPVPVDSLDFQALEMDLYLRYDAHGPLTLYRSAGISFSRDDLERLVAGGVKFVFVPASQHGAYRRSLTSRLTKTFKDPALAAAERGRIVRASCAKIIEDVMLFAGQAEPIEAVSEVSRTFVSWAREDPEGFAYLMDMSAHDFATATHMVNVGVGCGLLARELAPGDDSLFALAVEGGMLHDIGKRGIPAEILNKEGRLDAREWKQVAAHPERGYEELRKNPAIPEAVLSMARDHHERLDGSGYPRGLKGDQISLPARVCAVIDVFDAITAARPYRGPTAPAESLRIMTEGRGSLFDASVFDALVGIVDRVAGADGAPARAIETLPSLEDLLPSGPTPRGPDPGTPRNVGPSKRGKERRRFPRTACEMHASAVFHHQGKPLKVKPGEAFVLRVVDVGRGGVQVVTPWPMSLGDTLTVELTAKGGMVLSRIAKVVRVRKRGDGTWCAGLAFVDAAAGQAA